MEPTLTRKLLSEIDTFDLHTGVPGVKGLEEFVTKGCLAADPPRGEVARRFVPRGMAPPPVPRAAPVAPAQRLRAAR